MEKTIAKIRPLDENAMSEAKKRLDSLVKPPESLGVLEDIAIKLSGISGSLYNEISKRKVIVMAADNGVVAEGVASAPQEVTYIQTLNFGKGITGVSVLAKAFNADLTVIDVGVAAQIDDPFILNKKLKFGTGNIAAEEAMTRQQAIDAIHIGIDAAKEAHAAGYQCIGVGEMGIGNTTTSSAVLCGLLGFKTPQEVSVTVDRGAGLTDEKFQHKISVIVKALALHEPRQGDPLDILQKVGGLDLAAMCGVFIGAAACRIPVIIDGFISAVAALCAYRLNPLAVNYMFASHFSCERGYGLAIEELGLTAPLNLRMRLGEGSGCPIMFSVIDAAAAIIKNMGTFEQASVDTGFLENIEMDGFKK